MKSNRAPLIGRQSAVVAAIVGLCTEWVITLAVAASISGHDLWLLAATLATCTDIRLSLWRNPQFKGLSDVRERLNSWVLTPVGGIPQRVAQRRKSNSTICVAQEN